MAMVRTEVSPMLKISIFLAIGPFYCVGLLASSADSDVTRLQRIVTLQQIDIENLKSRLEKIERDINSGDIQCPQYQEIVNGADGQWHDLKIKFGQVIATYLNAHQGYHITADYEARGVHSLASWTALNTYSGGKKVIWGDTAGHGGKPGALELRWAGPNDGEPETYKFKLQIRTSTPRVDIKSGEVPNIAICIQPLPSALGINKEHHSS